MVTRVVITPALVALATLSTATLAQSAGSDSGRALTPATKLEAFRPAAGSVVTFGYNELGKVLDISVDAREVRDASGKAVRGLAVQINQTQYRRETSFIDEDEIQELIAGIDALLAITSNPTKWKMFEVTYKTKGGFELTAFSNDAGRISYSAETGRITTAKQFNLSPDHLRQLKKMFETAIAILRENAR